MSRKTTTKTLTVTRNGVTTTLSESVDAPMFPAGCIFCQRSNVCSKVGNSCGRPECNEGWWKKEAEQQQSSDQKSNKQAAAKQSDETQQANIEKKDDSKCNSQAEESKTNLKQGDTQYVYTKKVDTKQIEKQLADDKWAELLDQMEILQQKNK